MLLLMPGSRFLLLVSSKQMARQNSFEIRKIDHFRSGSIMGRGTGGYHSVSCLDVSRVYGIGSADCLSSKPQKTLPCDCRVMEFLNFTRAAR